MHPPLQALIFDVDGTLADTERDGHRVAFNTAFAEVGLPWHWDEALYGALLRVSGGPERMRAYARDDATARQQALAVATAVAYVSPADAPTDAQMARVPQAALDALISDLHRRKTRHYVAQVASGAMPLRPGVARLIHEARAAGLRLAIATTTTRQNVVALLQAMLGSAAPGWFEVMGTAQEVAAKKPDPAVYGWVLQQLALPATAALAIEDSRNGLQAALGAGLKCIVTATAYTATEDFTGAAVTLPDLDHLSPVDPRPVTLADLRRWHAAD